MEKFAIKLGNLGYVSGFSREHQCIQFTQDPSYVKTFKSAKLAANFKEKYEDCGYGMSSDSSQVVEVR